MVKRVLVLQPGNVLQFQNSPELLWRLSKATYFLSQIEGANGNQERKKNLIYGAQDAAQRALLASDQIASVHKWYVHVAVVVY